MGTNIRLVVSAIGRFRETPAHFVGHIWDELFEIMHGLIYIDDMRPVPLLNIEFGSRQSGGDLWQKVGALLNCQRIVPVRLLKRYVPILVVAHRFQYQGQTTVPTMGAFQ